MEKEKIKRKTISREAADRAAEKVDTEELPPGCPMPLDEAIRRVLKAPPMPKKDDSKEDD